MKGVLGAVAFPRFPAFLALDRAVLTMQRGVLTPGLPSAYPLPAPCLPRHATGYLGALVPLVYVNYFMG